MSLSFTNRIALYYMLVTAFLVFLAFLLIYFVVNTAVYRNLDQELTFETYKHATEVHIQGDSVILIDESEWEEREHQEVQVNPVFIQFNDKQGRVISKSPNLKEEALTFNKDKAANEHFNSSLNERLIRQFQWPLTYKGEVKGYVLAALPLEASLLVLSKLRQILLLLYPGLLIVLFFTSRFLASKSIQPITRIIKTTDRISRSNLNERIVLPKNKDELYNLTTSINSLLQRIQSAMEREKQFTSDASHELRTPLSVLKGTLEVLIRKPRQNEEYVEKIKYCLPEIERMTNTINQLLLLARLDKNNTPSRLYPVPLLPLIDEILHRHKQEIQEKKLQLKIDTQQVDELITDPYALEMILENLIVNAIKYAHCKTCVCIRVYREGKNTICQIKDQGVGIRKEDLEQVFVPFFRSDALNHKNIAGNGLGLSIVKKACEYLGAEIYLESNLQEGTEVTVKF